MIFAVDQPLCDVGNQKTQILIEFLDGTKKVQLATKKSTASRQKKFPKGLYGFAPIFGKLTAP